jgi:hypothetical protein
MSVLSRSPDPFAGDEGVSSPAMTVAVAGEAFM